MRLYLTLLNHCVVFLNQKLIKIYSNFFIATNVLKFTKETKHLDFTFNDSKCDDSDILRQMRLLYATSNMFLRTFTHCSSEDKVTLLKASVQHCVVLSCGEIIKRLRLVKFVSHLIKYTYCKIVGFSMQSAIYIST